MIKIGVNCNPPFGDQMEWNLTEVFSQALNCTMLSLVNNALFYFRAQMERKERTFSCPIQGLKTSIFGKLKF